MKILLPIDHSTCSSAAARAVLAQFPAAQTEVRVMHAVDWTKELPVYMAFAEGPTAARDLLDARGDRMEHGRFLADGVAQELQAAGFATSTDVREGNATEMILAAAAEWHPDLIVIGSHGRTGVGRLFLGSVAEHVMRHADCPVEVVPPAAGAARLASVAPAPESAVMLPVAPW
jgi:nucleotide-binding universal stress UspA family protein